MGKATQGSARRQGQSRQKQGIDDDENYWVLVEQGVDIAL